MKLPLRRQILKRRTIRNEHVAQRRRFSTPKAELAAPQVVADHFTSGEHNHIPSETNPEPKTGHREHLKTDN